MKQTEEDVLKLAKGILKDIKIDYYFEKTFKTYNTEDNEYLKSEEGVPSWKVSVEVPHEQFEGHNGLIVLIFNDELKLPFQYLDISGGRTVSQKVIKTSEGKYIVRGEWKSNPPNVNNSKDED